MKRSIGAPLFLMMCAFSPQLAAQGPKRPFDPAKDVEMSFDKGMLTLRVPAGVHLKQRFLKVELTTHPGSLRVGPLPPADGKDDAGDPVWRGTLNIPLAGADLKDPVVLKVTYQPCTEGADSVCFLPQHRLLTVASGSIPMSKP